MSEKPEGAATDEAREMSELAGIVQSVAIIFVALALIVHMKYGGHE